MAYGDAPIQTVISTVDTGLASAVNGVAGAISGAITPIAAACFSIYMILITVNYARGASSEPVWDFWLRMAGFALVIGLGINYSNYATYVMPIVKDLGNDLSALVGGGSDTATALDKLALHYIKIIDADYEKISQLGFVNKIGETVLWGIKSLVIIFTLVPFLVFAALLMIVAKVGVALVAAVGPLFFACLIFPATRQYFSAWLNTAFSYALIPVFVAIVAMFSVSISEEVFANPDDMSLFTVIIASIVNLLLVLLLKTCTSLASSLSAGGINTGFSAGGAYNTGKMASMMGGRATQALGIGAKGVGRGVFKVADFAAGGRISSAIQSFRQNGIKAG